MIQGFEIQYATGDGTMERLVAAFERAGAELRDFGRYLWPRLTPVLEEAERQQFEAEGRGVTGAWKPLSSQYEEWKRKNYPGRPILQRTGAMYEGLTASDSPFSAREANGDSYSFGTRGVTYASYHQTGTHRMPARQPFDFDSGFESELTRIAAAAAREALEQASVDQWADLSELSE